MQETIDETKQAFLKATERLVRVFEATPEDRVTWSPTPTARTPAQIVGHAAAAIKNIHGFMSGTPFAVASTAEAQALFQEQDKQYVSRE